MRLSRSESRAQMRTLAVAQHKKARAVELLLEGRSYDDIAHRVGYAHRGSAHRAVRQALEQRQVAAVDQLRQQEVGRLDALQALLWPLAEAGDVHAAASVVRIVEQRVRLRGLDRHGDGTFNVNTLIRRRQRKTRDRSGYLDNPRNTRQGLRCDTSVWLGGSTEAGGRSAALTAPAVEFRG